MFIEKDRVIHKTFGSGVVVADTGAIVIVQFESGLQSCLPDSLERVLDVPSAIAAGKTCEFATMLPHLQAKCIKSVNDQWGVFSRSKIDLLPHQLWVCRQARMKTPCRLMIADDVGLGKTIEAGLILSSMLAAGKLSRMLIMVPASLVAQWVKRMYEMFDIRARPYSPAEDTPDGHFWEMNDYVVASVDTLKMDNPGRRERFFSSKQWDLVVVDEAHHLNNDKKTGATQGFALLEEMEEHEQFRDLLFFTGTPHKGKNYPFLSLMRLLAPGKFDPERPMELQLDILKQYMIRNNKYNVTDLQGNRIFKAPIVTSMTYSYKLEEAAFYVKLTEFIESGTAYAGSLNRETGSVVMFVLITMQKLASSSVAAVRQALRRRIARFEEAKTEKRDLEDKLKELNEMDDESMLDQKNQVEEQLLELSSFVQIGQNERAALGELLSCADAIKSETKIEKIIETIEADFPSEPIAFFTEYKVTQSTLMSALMDRYGVGCVTFINGDEALDCVRMPDGSVKRLAIPREQAQDAFNRGEYRYIVSTEAAGEGIDLQERCHVLFHVDLPWNPMRLHQRVGRLNRYGQTQQVEVRSFRNPDTVESRIWDKLNAKLLNINQAFGAVMEEREDMFQLVLGMTPQHEIQSLFAEAPKHADEETLSTWFDARGGKIGGKDVVETVQKVLGNAARFNYNQVSSILPRVDLPDLLPFWRNILSVRNRRLVIHEGDIEFNTPDNWKAFGILPKYDDVSFSRKPRNRDKILGAGHKVFDAGVADALSLKCLVSTSSDIHSDYYVYSVCDQVTDSAREKCRRAFICEVSKSGDVVRVMVDWEFLKVLNQMSAGSDRPLRRQSISNGIFERCEEAVREFSLRSDFAPRVPSVTLEAALLASDN